MFREIRRARTRTQRGSVGELGQMEEYRRKKIWMSKGKDCLGKQEVVRFT